MQDIGFAAAAIGFWAFLTASAVAGIVADYKKRRLELKPLRAAIERGQQLDPAIIERLMLDPELSRLFAEANQPLSNAEFHARVIERLHQSYGWPGLARAVICGSRAAFSGLAMGIVAPFRSRPGHIGLMTVSAAALVIWATLQGA